MIGIWKTPDNKTDDTSVLPPAFEALFLLRPTRRNSQRTKRMRKRSQKMRKEKRILRPAEQCAAQTASHIGNDSPGHRKCIASDRQFLENILPDTPTDDRGNLEARPENGSLTPPEFPAEEAPQELQISRVEEDRPAPDLLTFYGLRQQAFDVTPDPAYLYFSPVHREAMSALSQGVQNLRGFLALIAEPGMGKTTLLNKLMEELRDSARVVFLFQTQCSSGELLRYLLAELEIEYEGMDIVAMHRALSQALFEEMLQGRRFVLIVDEAQNLQDSTLETIRLLSDYETTHSKLIQIVLAGQPQLVETLMRPGLAQLRQRIAVLASLKPLSVAETAEYVGHRLRAAGWSGGESLFTPDALTCIAESSAGVPRSINNICFNAMLAGYLQRKGVIDSEIVQESDVEAGSRATLRASSSGRAGSAGRPTR